VNQSLNNAERAGAPWGNSAPLRIPEHSNQVSFLGHENVLRNLGRTLDKGKRAEQIITSDVCLNQSHSRARQHLLFDWQMENSRHSEGLIV